MNEMILFKNDEIGVSVRTIEIDGVIMEEKLYLDAPGSNKLEITTINGIDYVDCRLVYKSNNYRTKYTDILKILKEDYITNDGKEYYSVLDAISVIFNKQQNKELELIDNIMNGDYVKANGIIIKKPKTYRDRFRYKINITENKNTVFLDAPNGKKLEITTINGIDYIAAKLLYKYNNSYDRPTTFLKKSRKEYIRSDGIEYFKIEDAIFITITMQTGKENELINNIINGDYVKANDIDLEYCGIVKDKENLTSTIFLDAPNSKKLPIVTIEGIDYIEGSLVHKWNYFVNYYIDFLKNVRLPYITYKNNMYFAIDDVIYITFTKQRHKQSELMKNIINSDYIKNKNINLSEYLPVPKTDGIKKPEIKPILNKEEVITNKVYLDAPGSNKLEITTINGIDYVNGILIHQWNQFVIYYSYFLKKTKLKYIEHENNIYFTIKDAIDITVNKHSNKQIDLINNIINGDYAKKNHHIFAEYYNNVRENPINISNKNTRYLDAPNSKKLPIVTINGIDYIPVQSMHKANNYKHIYDIFLKETVQQYQLINGVRYFTVESAIHLVLNKRKEKNYELENSIINSDYVKENKINLSEFRIATKISSQKQRIDYDLENKTSESNEPEIITIQGDSYESVMLPKETNNSEIKELVSEEINSSSNSILLQIVKENKSLFIADIQTKINKLQKTLEFIENLK